MLSRSIAVQPDGKILVGGSFSGANSIGGQTRNFIARLDAASGRLMHSTLTRAALSLPSLCSQIARS